MNNAVLKHSQLDTLGKGYCWATTCNKSTPYVFNSNSGLSPQLLHQLRFPGCFSKHLTSSLVRMTFWHSFSQNLEEQVHSTQKLSLRKQLLVIVVITFQFQMKAPAQPQQECSFLYHVPATFLGFWESQVSKATEETVSTVPLRTKQDAHKTTAILSLPRSCFPALKKKKTLQTWVADAPINEILPKPSETSYGHPSPTHQISCLEACSHKTKTSEFSSCTSLRKGCCYCCPW